MHPFRLKAPYSLGHEGVYESVGCICGCGVVFDRFSGVAVGWLSLWVWGGCGMVFNPVNFGLIG